MNKFELEMKYRQAPFFLPRSAARRRAEKEAKAARKYEAYSTLTYKDPTGELAVSRVLSS